MSIALETKYLNLCSYKLRNFKKKRNLLWNFSCPYCGDSKKDQRKARGYVYFHKQSSGLLYKCWNCPVSTTLPKLVEYLDPDLYKEMQMERFKSGEVKRNDKNEKPIEVGQNLSRLTKFVNKISELENYPKVSELDSSHPCARYVRERLIPESEWSRLYYVEDFKVFARKFTDKYEKCLKDDDSRLVIPFLNKENELTMLQGRAMVQDDWVIRYITLKFKEDEQKLFGLELVDPKKRIYVFEGPIDSMFIPNSVSSADSALYRVEVEGAKDIVRVFDNEPRNKEIVKLMEKCANKDQRVCIWSEKNDIKDVNDMVLSGRTAEDIQQEIDENTFDGLKLKAKISDWRKC